jgi:putative ABC transport system substrate-binding protein
MSPSDSLDFEPFAYLPGQNSTKFEMVVNLATGKWLGLVIPPSVLKRADEVIE